MDSTLEVGLQLLRHGTPDVALATAKCLGANAVSNVPATRCLEPDDTMRAMMKVFDTPNLSSEDIAVLHESVGTLVRARPRLAAQLVAACADPDPRIAFAALACTRMLLGHMEMCGPILKAGTVPAVMSALKHSNAYCRAAAASVAAPRVFDVGMNAAKRARMVGTAREALKGLLEAGLVPALMGIIRAGRSENAPPASPGVFSNIKVEMAVQMQRILLPNCEPALHACNTLQQLAKPQVKRPVDGGLSYSETLQVVEEVVKAPQAAAVLVQCLQQYAGALQDAPATLICALINTLLDPQLAPTSVHAQTFCKQLVEASLPDVLPSLIRPDQPLTTSAMLLALMSTVHVRGCCWLPVDSLPALAAACAKCVDAEVRDGVHQDGIRMMATTFLDKISGGFRDTGGVSRRVPRSQQSIATTAGITDERVVRASASAAGAEGPQAQRDPDSSKKGGKQLTADACAQCGKLRGDGVRLLTCSRCKTAVYCGPACQRSHWPLHKAECTAKQAAAEKS